MTRAISALWLLVAAATSLSGWVYEGSGYVHFEDGTVQEIESLNPFVSARGYSRGASPVETLRISRTETGAVLEVAWATVQEIVHIGSGNWIDGDKVHVTLRNGQEGEFYLRETLGYWEISYFDSFSQSGQKDQIESENFRRVVFGDDFGDARVNPSTGRIWPRSYRFDPFTGERLKWIETEGQSLRLHDGQDVIVRREYDFVQTSTRTPGFSDGPVPVEGEVRQVPDESDAELGEAVVDYSMTFMNPFSSSEEVTDALNRLRDEVLGD